MAYRLDNHVLDLKLGYQHIPYQGFPNQHMDMTHNESKQVNLGYTGRFAWGRLEGRVYHEETQHEMNFLEDKLYWYGAAHNVAGMPMNTDGKNTGLALKAEIIGSDRDLFRVGSEYQHYRLSDWWAPVDHSPMMSPNTFWNINNGQRDRFDVFGEWEAAWSTQWMTLLGARSSTVMMDTGTVQGYNASYNPSAFNNAERSRTDHNIDLSALARFTPDARQTYEGGYSRKTRSPSLYERYTWSTNGMAMTMNNWVNDGNGYVGNLDLKPEVAHTLSLSADWHDAGKALWNVKITPYYSLVNNYIDAQCLAASCPSNQYNYLTLINQDAYLYGLDLSGFAALGTVRGIGSFTARGMIAYVRGKNRDTGDYLYNIMPLNARLTLEHRLGNWTNTIEEQLVSAKDDVSRTRSEISTSGYSLLNLRSSYEWKNVRVDIGLDNALDKQYALPLGGAYIGQGMTMSIGPSTTWSGTTRPPYGYAVPGMGRSLFAAVTIKF
jgi:iron complex outermembrane receptor protein